ncbi:flagellar protein FlaG [Pseudaeromonas paramecii]|uniref:Flagellar protein FlaG n=1 Tax=Pseudaeromonas paramecii TaxID=2138166 RepID=A0ABP8Q317_9GAMM
MANESIPLTPASVSSLSVTDPSGRKAAQVLTDQSESVKSLAGSSATQTNTEPKEDAKSPADVLDDIIKQAQKLQEMSHLKGWAVNFRIDNDLDKTIITVVDSETQQMIRQIPSEELLNISRRVQSMQNGESGSQGMSGLLLDSQI